MRPLERQLEDRFSTLKDIHDKLTSLETEDIPQRMLQDLGIKFNLLDIDTGATHPSVMPCFLPRKDLPSCRDMKREIDSVWINGRHIDEGTDRSRVPFGWSLLLSLYNYSYFSESFFPDSYKHP
jgi:hypothetical protein